MSYEFPMILCAVCDLARTRLCRAIDFARTLFLCWLHGIKRSKGAWFSGAPLIRTRNSGSVVIGEGTCLQSRSRLNLVGIVNQCVIDTRAGGSVYIGKNSGITSCVINSRERIHIGDNVNIGGNVRIFDHDFHSLNALKRRSFATDFPSVRSLPVNIGDDVFIGTNAIILKGSDIGARTIVAEAQLPCEIRTPAGHQEKCGSWQ